MVSILSDRASRAPDLSIGAVTARTGVSAAALRTWETRYGFPRPHRLEGGHRRYRERDIDAVREIVRRRAAGHTMAASVAAARAHLAETEPSVFAGLRRRRPELLPRTIRKGTILALSRAIEDECCARADRPALFACFQEGRFFDQSRARWTELARTAQIAAVFADFADGYESTAAPLNVHLPADATLRREWIVVCDSPDYPACLAAWELPGGASGNDADRIFEAIWTVDPRAVRVAAQICAGLVDAYRDPESEPTSPIASRLDDDRPPAASADLRRADGLINRTLDYLDGAVR